MGKAVIEFIDAEDGTVELSFHADPKVDGDDPNTMTEAQYMAVIALQLFSDHIQENELDMVDVSDLDLSKLN